MDAVNVCQAPKGETKPGASTGIAAAAVGAGIGGVGSLLTAERPNKNGVYLIFDDRELTIIHEVSVARPNCVWMCENVEVLHTHVPTHK